MNGIALRGQKTPRPQGLVCQFCQFSKPPTRRRTPFARQYASASPLHRSGHLGQLRSKTGLKTPSISSPLATRRFESSTSQKSPPLDPEAALQEVAHEASIIHNTDSVPPDASVVQLLEKCQAIAEVLVSREQDHQREASSAPREEGNVISSLLDLEEKNAKKHPVPAGNTHPQLVNSVSRIANDIVKDEKVFISPSVLACYTEIQTLLNNAEHFPETFHLYAHKPVPEQNTSPVKYHKANASNINSAVPSELANMALDVAIEQRNLSLVLAIIDNTFCTKAFHRSKVFRKASAPLLGMATAPVACYSIASWASSLQNTMDSSTATGIAFAAGLAYVGGVSSIGVLAITTANDQMERVTWLPGIPLRHRWLREEERAAMDKVALAWGFKSIDYRGEEEGEEWEALREFIGMRGMILDRTDLMPGMQ
ncbi:uncharacterized protein ASPGLDRAFT_70380 [Aspergillus glaucus CBS 516.65]|uniref:Uncharacterized protein n=1 Tax=Aspergillus glaucus CBS 516.65 TaxID=1160497 RepID=A0A1L9V541_ASPGL|nr:hypothetical protein ASPGLDRAFT_70380 [Aspergillus glaucus CBS 516.65]OJJ79021.1 hypothetical protein ASPGLDRAFT_70380 [Aspergillus glaucus CBS 516.65]